ncbi:5-hydroxytryptamine receptor 3A-like [Paralichthys olivaceus]|uniref:5-hydroxytryptamine receptor 3A-like n=1 Tax=Paralichthys olivaceus TaxID=8255 RepID=UPI00097D61C1|nr:PREDICTED: 5-hydroxytryptamine receptor 3A-like [Paralichthys olivaceus]
MMLFGSLLLLVFFTGDVRSEENCSYQDVLNYLNISRTNERFTMSRPVKNYRHATQVYLEVLLYAILDVVEKEQKFIPYVWTVMRWHNEYISWDPKQFCGIDNVSLPTELLWKPDITIEEMTEKDRAPPSPYLTINDKGDVEVHNDQVLVSSCRMHIYKFPFDIQSCSLSFKSVIHTAKDIRLRPSDNSSEATEWSREVMRTQYEWLFINMTVTANNATDPLGQDIIVYTINMRRRSALYIVNFILPILFFLGLDLASFLISDTGSEKLNFKVTVLLAVTVLQLILNEILPSSSNRIPLIAVYCIGIFALMMLSLLETILVMYLIERDSAPQDNEMDEHRSLREECNQGKDNFQNCHDEMQTWTQCSSIYDGAGETPSEQLSMANEHQSRRLVEQDQVLEKVSDELREMEKTLSLILSSRRDEFKPGYWSTMAKRVNKAFFIFYVIVISVFLFCIFVKWKSK